MGWFIRLCSWACLLLCQTSRGWDVWSACIYLSVSLSACLLRWMSVIHNRPLITKFILTIWKKIQFSVLLPRFDSASKWNPSSWLTEYKAPGMFCNQIPWLSTTSRPNDPGHQHSRCWLNSMLLMFRYQQNQHFMMTSSNGNIFRVIGPLCGEFTGHRWIPLTRPVMRSFAVFCDLCLNKRLSKHSYGW